MDISDEILIVSITIGNSIYECRSYIDDDRLGSDHISREKSRTPDRDDDDISTLGDIREIVRLSIAARHGRSCIHEHESHRLAHDIGSPEDCHSLAYH
jgi:hypothetical protein